MRRGHLPNRAARNHQLAQHRSPRARHALCSGSVHGTHRNLQSYSNHAYGPVATRQSRQKRPPILCCPVVAGAGGRIDVPLTRNVGSALHPDARGERGHGIHGVRAACRPWTSFWRRGSRLTQRAIRRQISQVRRNAPPGLSPLAQGLRRVRPSLGCDRTACPAVAVRYP